MSQSDEENRLITQIKTKLKYFQFQLSNFDKDEFLDNEFEILLDEVTRYIFKLNNLNAQNDANKEEKNNILATLTYQQNCLYYKYEEQMLTSFKLFVTGNCEQSQEKLSAFLSGIDQNLTMIENLAVKEKPNLQWKQKCWMMIKFLKDHYQGDKELRNRTNEEKLLYDRFIADIKYVTEEITNLDENISGSNGSDSQSLYSRIKKLQDILNKIDSRKHREFLKNTRNLSNKIKESYDNLGEKVKEREQLEETLKNTEEEIMKFSNKIHAYWLKNFEAEDEYNKLEKELRANIGALQQLKVHKDLQATQKRHINKYENLHNELNLKYTEGKQTLTKYEQTLKNVEYKLCEKQQTVKNSHFIKKHDGGNLISEIKNLLENLETIDETKYTQFKNNKEVFIGKVKNLIDDIQNKVKEREKIEMILNTKEEELKSCSSKVNIFLYKNDKSESESKQLESQLIENVDNIKKLHVPQDLKINQVTYISKYDNIKTELQEKVKEGKQKLIGIEKLINEVESSLNKLERTVINSNLINKKDGENKTKETNKIYDDLHKVDIVTYNQFTDKKIRLNRSIKILFNDIGQQIKNWEKSVSALEVQEGDIKNIDVKVNSFCYNNDNSESEHKDLLNKLSTITDNLKKIVVSQDLETRKNKCLVTIEKLHKSLEIKFTEGKRLIKDIHQNLKNLEEKLQEKYTAVNKNDCLTKAEGTKFKKEIETLKASLEKINVYNYSETKAKKNVLIKRLTGLLDVINQKVTKALQLSAKLLQDKQNNIKEFTNKVKSFSFQNSDSESKFTNLYAEITETIKFIQNLELDDNLKTLQQTPLAKLKRLLVDLDKIEEDDNDDTKSKIKSIENELMKVENLFKNDEGNINTLDELIHILDNQIQLTEEIKKNKFKTEKSSIIQQMSTVKKNIKQRMTVIQKYTTVLLEMEGNINKYKKEVNDFNGKAEDYDRIQEALVTDMSHYLRNEIEDSAFKTKFDNYAKEFENLKNELFRKKENHLIECQVKQIQSEVNQLESEVNNANFESLVPTIFENKMENMLTKVKELNTNNFEHLKISKTQLIDKLHDITGEFKNKRFKIIEQHIKTYGNKIKKNDWVKNSPEVLKKAILDDIEMLKYITTKDTTKEKGQLHNFYQDVDTATFNYVESKIKNISSEIHKYKDEKHDFTNIAEDQANVLIILNNINLIHYKDAKKLMLTTKINNLRNDLEGSKTLLEIQTKVVEYKNKVWKFDTINDFETVSEKLTKYMKDVKLFVGRFETLTKKLVENLEDISKAIVKSIIKHLQEEVKKNFKNNNAKELLKDITIVESFLTNISNEKKKNSLESDLASLKNKLKVSESEDSTSNNNGNQDPAESDGSTSNNNGNRDTTVPEFEDSTSNHNGNRNPTESDKFGQTGEPE